MTWQYIPNDLAYAFRQMRRSPMFTLCVVGVLALGIGANTAIFSVIQSLILQPLPYPQPERLVMIWETNPSQGLLRESVSGPAYLDWKEKNRTLEEVAAMQPGTGTLSGFGEPRQFPGLRVTTNFLTFCGAKPAAGRLFDARDGIGANFHNNAVISHRMWRDLNGASPNLVGKVFRVDLLPYTVIGITNEDFWLPVRADGFVPWPDELLRSRRRSERDLVVIARLKPGVTLAQAQRDLDDLSRQIEQDHPGLQGWTARVTPMTGVLTDSIRPALLVLFGAVALALLIGCANIANLLLARALSRRREIAVRSALGAPRSRITQQILTESVALALIGGVAGILLAFWMTEGLVRLLPASITTTEGAGDLLLRKISVAPWVLAVTTIGSVLTGLLFGLIPAMEAARTDLREPLQEGSRGSSTGGAFWRKVLLGTQVAVTLLLVSGCGALLTSFLHLRSQGAGLQVAQLLTLEIELPTDARYKKSTEQSRFFRTVADNLSNTTGVESAGLISELPLSRSDRRVSYEVSDGPGVGRTFAADLRHASAGYLSTVRIPLLRGRWLADSDLPERGWVAVVDESFAKRHWPNENPIGRQLKFYKRTLEVVGVVGSVKHAGLTQSVNPTIYVSFLQVPSMRMGIALRAAGEPPSILAAVKRAVWSVDKDIPVFHVRTMQEAMDDSLDNPRLTLLLVSVFAMAALILSTLGTYGVVAYQTGTRMREFGIRIALGAEPVTIVKMVLGQIGYTLAIALPAGIVMSFIFNRLMGSILYGVSPSDPRILGAASLFLLAVALIASLGPAVRAARSSSIHQLRAE